MMKTTAVISCLLGMLVVAQAGSWQIKNLNFATICDAISFTSESDGLAPAANNGEGSLVLRTTDGGGSWTKVPAPEEAMFLGGAAQGNSAVASAMLSAIYSNELIPGQYNFTTALQDGVISQNVEAFSKTYYGMTGSSVLGQNGVAVSGDSGAIFQFINITVLKTDARYGAFPSESTWYISAGTWPNNNNSLYKREGLYEFDLTNRFKLRRSDDLKSVRVERTSPRKHRPEDDNGWQAQIVKTTDGGKTWSSVFWNTGEFYFNQIHCGSETHCIAVGEADSSAKSGIRIYATQDGGNTWNQTFYDPDPAKSLMAVRMLSESEAWVAGGKPETLNFEGYFLHTTDGGNTWTTDTVKGVYGNSLSFPSDSVGYASAFNFEDNSAILKYQ